MHAVWSFWSKPYRRVKGRTWREPRHHLLAWGLSLRLARAHFPQTQLVTDTAGKALLVDELGLQFDSVSTELDRLEDADDGWWALGKLFAYSIQTGPFVHLDTDVFLWKGLPASLLTAPVLAQCPEFHPLDRGWCAPREIEARFVRHGLKLPVEWEWAASRQAVSFREENCGILGGTRVDFLRHYAEAAINLITDPQYACVWKELHHKDGFNQILEQFLLSCCIDYHRIAPESPFRGVNVRYIFPTWGEACHPEAASRAGFTHLLGDAKAHPAIMARMERRMEQLDPGFLRHCERVARSPLALEDAR